MADHVKFMMVENMNIKKYQSAVANLLKMLLALSLITLSLAIISGSIVALNFFMKMYAE